MEKRGKSNFSDKKKKELYPLRNLKGKLMEVFKWNIIIK